MARSTAARTEQQAPKSKKNQVRTFKIIQRPRDNGPAVVRFTVNGVVTDRKVSEIYCAPDFGFVAYEFSKGGDSEPRHCFICHDGTPICDCPGFVSRGECVHSACALPLYRAFRRSDRLTA